MSRQHGTKAAIFLDDGSNACKNISGDVTSLTFNGLKNRPDTTSMGVDDIRRELDGVRDATFDVSILYSQGTGACPGDLLSAMHSGSDHKRIQYFPAYNTSNSPYLTASAFLNNFNINTPVDGVSTMSATFELASNRVLTSDVYAQKVLNTSSGCLIGYWPLWDVSASTNDNYEGTAARDATSVCALFGQTGIGDGRTSACLDGSNSYINAYTTSLCSVFNGAEGTIVLWAKVSGAGVWEDSTLRDFSHFAADGDNEIFLRKDSTNNTLTWKMDAGGTVKSFNTAGNSDTGWFQLAIAWSEALDVWVGYKNGVQAGSQTSLGTWAGDLASTTVIIGGDDTTPATSWDGMIAHVACWTTPLTPAQILNLASV